MQKYFKSIKHVGAIMFVITFIAFMLMAFANNRNNIKSSNVSTDFVKISTIQAKDLNKYNAEPLSDGSVNAAMKVAKNDNSMLYQSLRIAATDKINTDTLGNNFVDYIKPNATYQYTETDVDNDGKTFTMVFDMTDKFYTSGTLTLDDLTILIDGEEPNWTEVSKSLQEEDRTNIVNGESKVIGKRYTLTLSNLEQIQVKEGDNYLDYSGVITVAIPADKIVDETGNANNAVTLTSGISLPGGTGTAEVVDVVKPLVEKISSSVDATNGTASLVFRATDKYYASTTLTKENLQITVDGELVDSTGITKEVTSTALNEQRLVNGTTQTVQYGIQFTVNLSGLDTSVSQIKVRVPANAILDQSGNGNEETDLLVLNTLRSTKEEQMPESSFLGNTNIQRWDVDQVEFVDSIPEVVLPSDSSLLRKYDATNNTGNGHSNTTTTWKDLSGHQDGTVHGATWGDNYLSFNGTVSDWVGCGNISVTDKVTIDATIVVKSIKEGYADIINNYQDSGVGLDLYNGYPGFEISLAYGSYTQIRSDTPVTVGEKIRITGSYDGKHLYLYINGKLEKVQECTGALAAPTGNTILVMGNNAAGSGVIEGESADINIYSASVYNDAVQTNMWDVSAAQDCSIVAWYDTNPNGNYKVYIGSDNEIFGNTDSSYLFAYIGYNDNCTETETIKNIELLNVSNVTNMSNMFNVTGNVAMTSLDLGDNFDTSNVTNMSYMFFGTGSKNMTTFNIGNKFNTKNVTDMSFMFDNIGYSALTSLDLGDNFDTSNVTNMTYMFYGAGYKAMTNLNLGDKFDTKNVTNMKVMFRTTGYTAMTSLELGDKFDTSNVTDMSYMFVDTGYTAMTSLDLGDKFDTSNVTNMSNMFYGTGYNSMTTLDLGENFNTSNVENMSGMFWNCGHDKMTSLDLGDKFNTSKVINMDSMFFYTGIGSMTSLDLGPAFTNIAEVNSNMFIGTGKYTEIVIYVPEAIYQDKANFKLNSESTITIPFKDDGGYVLGTINPKYRTEWQKENVQTDTTTDANNPKLNVTLRGTTNPEVAADEYISDVTSSLTADDIKVFIDDTEVTDLVTTTVGGATQTNNTRTGAQDVLQVITITNFEEASRQAGKLYKEWSGNFRIEIAQGTLSDTTGPADAEGNRTTYGNKNMGLTDDGSREDNKIEDETKVDKNTEGAMFVDFIEPEFTYEYASTDINYDEKTLTVEFSVTDKYFNSVTISQDNITVKMIEEDITPETITKTLTKVDDITETRDEQDVKIGETYRLVISGFEQASKAEGENYKDYSGPVSIAFPASILTDKSGNTNVQKTITVGINEPDQTGDAEVVDVVDPIWEAQNVQIDANNDKVTVDLIGTDKYYANTTLDVSKIKVIIDGEEITSTTNVTKALSTATTLTENRDGSIKTYGVKYTLTLSNWKETDATFEASGRQYREYSGNTQIQIEAGTLVDESGNENEQATLDLGMIDIIKPEIHKVSSTKNDANKTETIVFDVIDKYFDSAQISATDTSKLTVYVDNEEAIGVTKTITNTEDITATINGTSKVIGKRYTLVISNFEQERTTPVNYDREYSDWSGDVFVQVAPATVVDESGNTN